MTDRPDLVTKPDGFLGGRVRLHQLATGYRAGMDAALLAAALDLKPGMRAAEFGCGAGAALLSAAVLYPDSDLIGVEREADAAELARRNVALNGLEDRVRIDEVDALVWRGARELDAVFFNPPFFDDPGSLRAPKDEKAPAWMSEAGLGAWIDAGLKRLRSGGQITLIQRADRLDDILAALIGRAGAVGVRPIQSRVGAPAKRVLVQATKAAKGPLQLMPAVILHRDGEGRFTDEADALFSGAARLAMRA